MGPLGVGGAQKQLTYLAGMLLETGAEVRVYSLSRGEYYEQVLQDMGLEIIWFGSAVDPVRRLIRLVSELARFKPHIIQTSELYTGLYAGFAGRLWELSASVICATT